MGLKDGAGLEQWEIAVTKKIVGELRRRSRTLAREDFDDLEQECLLHWIQVRKKLVPVGDGPPIAYMSQVLRNKLTDLTRERVADKRGGEQDLLSLDAPLPGADDGLTLSELIADSSAVQSGGEGGRAHHHTALDVARAVERLTRAQRRLCAMLGEEGLSVKEAAARLRIPRGTLYEEIKRIRKILTDQGFSNYFEE